MSELAWATPEDRDDVLDLVEAYHRQEEIRRHSREVLQGILNDLLEHRDRGRVLVARDGKQVVGYAFVLRRPSFEWASDIAVVDELFVLGRARERGLGRRMLAFIEEYAASEGLPTITLDVSKQNVAAQEFYRAIGFTRVDREIFARKVAGPR